MELVCRFIFDLEDYLQIFNMPYSYYVLLSSGIIYAINDLACRARVKVTEEQLEDLKKHMIKNNL